MATTLTYSAADKKRLTTFTFNSAFKPNSVRRAIKMLKPMCPECYGPAASLEKNPQWWEACPHNPWVRLVPKKIRVPQYVTDDDGDLVLDEEATKKSMKTKMVLVPNVVEVIFHKQMQDRRLPLMMKQLKGCKTMEEGGFAPMCEALGCGRAWPTFKSAKEGTFCSEEHAMAVARKRLGQPSLMFASSDVTEEQLEVSQFDMKATEPPL